MRARATDSIDAVATAMLFKYCSHAFAMLLPCCCHVVAMPLQGCCYAVGTLGCNAVTT